MDSMTLSEQDAVFDEKNQRILFPNGVMVTNIEKYMSYMEREFFSEEQYNWSNIKLFPNRDTRLYLEKYTEDVSFLPERDLFLTRTERNEHTQEEVEELYSKIINSSRYKKHYEQRILEELDYFDRSNTVCLMLKINELIERFREDNVLWGVGRGSSCASLVLYCLYVHDVDSLEYDIPFKEFSKE